MPKYAKRTSVVEAAYNYSLEQMQEQVIEQRNMGIKKVIAAGSVLDMLKERYAKGEINEQEFEEKKRKLL